MAELVITDPMSGLGSRAWRAYMEDVVSRYWERRATPEEVEQALREDPSDDVVPPTGLFVLAVADGEPML